MTKAAKADIRMVAGITELADGATMAMKAGIFRPAIRFVRREDSAGFDFATDGTGVLSQ
jgi:hypothetical protein